MSSSNCYFLNWIQISQEAGRVVWYSHLFKIFAQFVVIHTVKGFGIANKAEVDAFLMIQQMSAFWSLVPLPFLNPAWTSGSSRFTHRVRDSNVFPSQKTSKDFHHKGLTIPGCTAASSVTLFAHPEEAVVQANASPCGDSASSDIQAQLTEAFWPLRPMNLHPPCAEHFAINLQCFKFYKSTQMLKII